MGRRDLKEALAYCKRNKQIKYFIIDEVDRFMRSIEEYYWYKVEFKKLGVKLVFASQPELSEDGQFAKLRELLAVYESESSNAERSRKTFDKMKARVAAGYYPFNKHAGYKKTGAADGLHVPDDPNFTILQKGSRLIIYDHYTPVQAVKWMNDNGYRTVSGKKLTIDHYIEFIVDPYYCGEIVINKPGWTPNPNGLHMPMFSKREHKLLVAILKKRNPRVRLAHNPDFPLSNILRHEECVGLGGYEKFTGVNFNRGKRPSGSQRPIKKVYDCRDCRKRIPRDKTHENLTKLLARMELIPNKEQFKKALLKVWKKQRGVTDERLRVLNANRERIEEDIRKTTIDYVSATDTLIKKSLGNLIASYHAQLAEIDNEVVRTQNLEQESEDFVEFALDFVENFKYRWWTISPENRKRGEQLLFNGKIYANNDAIIHTPNLSSIYRLGTNKKDLGKVSLVNMVELAGIAPASEGLS